MVEELGEVMKADKRWKTHRNHRYEPDEKLDEIADVFITAMNISIHSGFTAEDIEKAISNKIKENPKWEYYQDYIGDPEPHKCPVCGEYEFEDILCHDICPVCGWEDDGMEVDPRDENGGPSEEFIEHKKWFEDQRKLNPKFKITSRRKIIK